MEENLTATRFAQKPLHQPNYSFCHVPKAARDLQNSNLQEISNREHFQTAMAEMLLLCKEATRRRPGKPPGGSKPLSLEYMADRLDVDDPLFGYLVRTHESANALQNWKKGMLQGFITVTTFTNWQRTFRWDSADEAAFEAETEEMEVERRGGVRKWDSTNELAHELQQTIRFGDIWNEGVVWPRIAEISLLGGLGCGKVLLSLAIEQLECMRSTDNANYDYVVLQATDNSIPFYESMGFVRVGAVTEVDEAEKNKEACSDDTPDSVSEGDDLVAEPVPEGSPEKPDALALPVHIVSCALTTFTVKKAGTTINDIAKRFQVDPWDICYLNRSIYDGVAASSRLLQGTMLRVPLKKKAAASKSEKTRAAQTAQFKYFIAKENDTPRKIAKMHEISCRELVDANKQRHPGLLSNSRLKQGTKIRISHLDQADTVYKPYAHWSFPDDNFEEGEPSYMMARKLNRRRGAAAQNRPFLASLASYNSGYEPTELLIPPSPVRQPKTPATSSLLKREKPTPHPDEPKPPKRPLSSFFFFASEQRELQKEKFEGQPPKEISKVLGDQWKALSEEAKVKYVDMGAIAKEEYYKKKAVYDEEMAVFRAKHPQLEGGTLAIHTSPPADCTKRELFNMVVKLKPEAVTEGCEYKYWYVLTYIPDLKWCHLAPLIKVGTFGPDKPRANGRPKWMLVDESLGKEVDISASFCIPIKARFMRKTLDADKEEWDVIDDGTLPAEKKAKTPRAPPSDDSSTYSTPSMPSLASGKESGASKVSQYKGKGALIAVFPDSSSVISVKLRIKSLDEKEISALGKRCRGRPRKIQSLLEHEVGDVGVSSAQSNRVRVLSNDRGNSLPRPSKKKRGPAKVPKCRAVYKEKKEAHSQGSSTPVSSPTISARRSPRICKSTPNKGLTESISGKSRPRSSKAVPVDGTVRRSPRTTTPKSSNVVHSDTPNPSGRKRVRCEETSGRSSSRPRRSAAPTFLGETTKSPKLTAADKIPYKPRSAKSSSTPKHTAASGRSLQSSSERQYSRGKLESPKAAAKRWHPIRDTRNGKTVARNTTPRRLRSTPSDDIPEVTSPNLRPRKKLKQSVLQF